jgi:hypothetical protein
MCSDSRCICTINDHIQTFIGTECTRSATAYWLSIEGQVVGLCYVDWQSGLELATQIFLQIRESFRPKALCKASYRFYWAS